MDILPIAALIVALIALAVAIVGLRSAGAAHPRRKSDPTRVTVFRDFTAYDRHGMPHDHLGA